MEVGLPGGCQACPTPQCAPTGLRLRGVARPDKMAAELLHHLGLELG